MRMRNEILSRTPSVLLMAGSVVFLCQQAAADMKDWESSLETMKQGANLMIEGRKTMQEKKDLGSAEKVIKDGHRMMMQAEREAARIQIQTMKRGAQMMMDGLRALKSKNDPVRVEKQMAQGQEMILEAEKMMADTLVQKMMQGSRTMMRGLRMMQKTDLSTVDKLMTDGQRLVTDASRTIADNK
jgi:hypothetical protein